MMPQERAGSVVRTWEVHSGQPCGDSRELQGTRSELVWLLFGPRPREQGHDRRR